MDVGKSKVVWSGNNRCHMSQDNVIKFRVALHPSFPDLYSVLRFLEQGFKVSKSFNVYLLPLRLAFKNIDSY